MHSLLKKILISIAFVGVGSIPCVGYAATFFLSPPSLAVSVGDTVAIDVNIESEFLSVNAVSGTLSFPKNLLTVESVSKEDSVLDLWTVAPSLSSANGTIVFEGVSLKGFSGPQKKLFSIIFRAVGEGSALLSFSATTALANDGKGSAIPSNTKDATISIQKVVAVAASESVTPAPAPRNLPAMILGYGALFVLIFFAFGAIIGFSVGRRRRSSSVEEIHIV